MNNSSKFKVLFILVLLCGIVFGILFFTSNINEFDDDSSNSSNNNDSNSNDNDTSNEDDPTDDDFREGLDEGEVYNQLLPLTSFDTNAWLISTVNAYFSFNSSRNNDIVYNILDDNYRLTSIIHDEYASMNYSRLTINEVTYFDNESIVTYFVKGYPVTTDHGSEVRGNELVIIVQEDKLNGTYSILPTDYSNLDVAESSSIKSRVNEIIANSNNIVTDISQSSDVIARYLFNSIYNEMLYNPETAYDKMLVGNEQYKFSSRDEFMTFIDSNIDDLLVEKYMEHDIDRDDDQIIYEVVATSFNYTFYVDSVYNYKVVIE